MFYQKIKPFKSQLLDLYQTKTMTYEPKLEIKFEKISFEQYYKDLQKCNNFITKEQAKEYYDKIMLPKRATNSSAGYDFSLTYPIEIEPNKPILVPTGIKIKLPTNLVCLLMPRSSMGFKYGMCLDNTVGVIDADYYFAENEGHIMASLTFRNIEHRIKLETHERFMQAIIVRYYQTHDDTTDTARVGGMGSTGK